MDEVNYPDHYMQGGLEVIDIIEAKLSPEEYVGYLRGAIIKYVFRYKYKGQPIQDLEKAQFYLARLIAYLKHIEELKRNS